MPDTQPLFRCAHCRGFYDAERDRCPWCEYDAPQRDAAGQPVRYRDRLTARAVQIAEYDQLPPEAHADPMKPPAALLGVRCGCLHCGPDGEVFEAVEMRWLANEQMWACPCTTCGGRGFQFDIHPLEPLWQCVACGHWYRPERPTHEFALCPQCGSTEASGWFEFDDDSDDELDEWDDVPWDEDEFAAADAEGAGEDAPKRPEGAPFAEPAPDWKAAAAPWYPGKDEDDEAEEDGRERLPDDIDFPRDFRDEPRELGRGDEDDIPF